MQTRCCWEVRCSGSSKNRAIIALNAKSVILLPLYRNKTCKTILTCPAIHDTLYRKSHRACRGNAPPSCCARPLCRLKAPLGLSLLRKRSLVEKYRTARIYSPWRFLPPRNTPDLFCRLLHPTKFFACLAGRYFSFGKLHLEFFISRLNEILRHDLTLSVGEPDNAAAKQG